MRDSRERVDVNELARLARVGDVLSDTPERSVIVDTARPDLDSPSKTPR